MLDIIIRKQFKKDYARALKRGCRESHFLAVLSCLQEEKPLPKKHRDHALSGKYAKFRECHITPDWLLIYEINHRKLTLVLTRTGTHSDLFKE